jgi:ribosomal protein L14
MFQTYTRLKVADNPVPEIDVHQCAGGTGRKYAVVGDVIVAG